MGHKHKNRCKHDCRQKKCNCTSRCCNTGCDFCNIFSSSCNNFIVPLVILALLARR
ncbi:hypothetical protein CLLI_12350 [Clostridium liquoris]|uniref:Uncharacterized protein n=1 Tax=Clostridium liquoris TaxID=1289519 RepID=A0A2T0B4T8_9CLOT|nr:hypothetical protein [Clostridium liquoris]PRR78896.1 hypothetical protein CLLI_12350 [Clostridium liquoris]